MTETARGMRLWEDRSWRLLVHYRRSLWGGYKSESTLPSFFLAPNGRRSPQVELEATLAAFFEPEPRDAGTTHSQCRFPERYAWLKERLGSDPRKLPERSCPEFENWRKALDPRSVSLVFASGFLNNPSTLYGHTFLKLEHKAHGEGGSILDYTINFAAHTGDTNGVHFVFKGLAGLYPGRFSSAPYYVKVQEYSNIESRDLWEYPLGLDQAQVDRLVRHAWELGSAAFPYYFLTRNCSYQLLPLLEVADPALHLKEALRGWVIPADTLRVALRGSPAASARYRPSLWSQVAWRRSQLSREEAGLARQFVRGDLPDAVTEVGRLAPGSQAKILETAYDYLRFLSHLDRVEEKESDARGRQILLARSRLGSVEKEAGEPPRPRPPEAGHDTMRLGVGFGFSRASSFEEVYWRAGLHDLLDPPEGYLPDSRLEMGHLHLRWDNKRKTAYVNRFDLLHITALNPWDSWVPRPSWEVSTGLRQQEGQGRLPGTSLYYGLQVGGGLALAAELFQREVFYALAQFDSGFGGVFRKSYRIGGGVKAGLQATLLPWWRLLMESEGLGYGLGDAQAQVRFSMVHALQMTPKIQIRLGLLLHGSYKEAAVTLHRYFFPG